METTLTAKQIMDLGLWSKVCEYKGWDEWIVNEGRISEDELITFDSNFEKVKEEAVVVRWKDTLNCEKLFPNPLWECIRIANELNFEYILFNGLVYRVNGDSNYICIEEDLVI